MTMTTLVRLLPLLLFLFSCTTSAPSAADVAADRARWTAVRDALADGVIDDAEAQALADLLVVWDEKNRRAEEAANAALDPGTEMMALVRAYGDAIADVFTPNLRKYAPLLFDVIDKDQSGSISVQEIRGINWSSPALAVVVTHTVIDAIKARSKRK